MEPQTTRTAEQLVDPSGESLKILQHVLDGVKVSNAAKDFVGVRLHLLDAVRLQVLTMELVDLLEQVVIDDPDLLTLTWQRGAILGGAHSAICLGGWMDGLDRTADALGWFETARNLGDPSAQAIINELAGRDTVPRPTGDSTCVACKRPTGLPVQLRYCEDCAITNAVWRPDPWAITRAAKHLGLKQNAHVIVANAGWEFEGISDGIRHGTYTGLAKHTWNSPSEYIRSIAREDLSSDMEHRIIVAPRLTVEHANRVIWHELGHAVEFEREPLTYEASYAAEKERVQAKYANSRAGVPEIHHQNHYEIVATATEHEADGFESLALRNKRANLPYDSRHEEILAVVDGEITPGRFAERQRAHRVERRSTAKLRHEGKVAEPTAAAIRRITDPRPVVAPTPTTPWDGWPGSLLAFAGVYSLLTFLSIKLGADIGAPIMAAFLAGAIVLLTAFHLRANWVGTLALSLVVAIPWFIATVVINAVMFPPY